jgi:hypothetical protein
MPRKQARVKPHAKGQGPGRKRKEKCEEDEATRNRREQANAKALAKDHADKAALAARRVQLLIRLNATRPARRAARTEKAANKRAAAR